MSREFNIYSGGKYLATLDIPTLRERIRAGEIAADAQCAEVVGSLVPRQKTPIPITELSDVSDLCDQLAAAEAPPPPIVHPPSARSASGRLSVVGWLLIVGGLGCVIYFVLVYDTSVHIESPIDLSQFSRDVAPDRVTNLGLMQNRLIGIIVGFGFAFMGGILVGIDRLRRRNAT
ncbi:MAG: hypothetical protein QOH88_3032 [Verrucomicrobiota bacterium]|jgi:hypothetical protein